MSYPSVAFLSSSPVAGIQPISETSTTQHHPLGMIVRATDLTYGEGTFIYLKGVASTAVGDVVCYNSSSGATVRALAGGASSIGPAAVAMSANVASSYGWYQIAGATPVTAATVAANAQAYLTSTAGTVDDAVTASAVLGMTFRAATSGGYATAQLAFPSIPAAEESAVPTGAAGRAGIATLSSGVATVSSTAVTASSVILLTRQTAAGTMGAELCAKAADITAGTSFIITALKTDKTTETSDTSTVYWFFVN